RTTGGFEEVPVTVRAAGRGQVAVEGDLAPGDRVALTDPSAPAPGAEDRGDEEPDAAAVPTPGGAPGGGPVRTGGGGS
ncbi:MAG: hypothetical protein PVG07_04105, partial [Acidobacteriota bacterium]